jgi:hypothetical protein
MRPASSLDLTFLHEKLKGASLLGLGLQMFGKEAMKYVDYVECYPEGYRTGVQIAKE